MIPDYPRTRLLTRTCITLVSSIAPLSAAYVSYAALTGQCRGYKIWLFAICLMETLFCIWWILWYKLRETTFERVVPSRKERQKMKEDCLKIIHKSTDHGRDFIEGWFRIGREKASITDLKKENIKEWCHLPWSKD